MIFSLFSRIPFLLLAQLLCSSRLCKAEDDVIFASQGSNTCPVNYSKITSSKWACIAAMAIGDSTLNGDQDAETFNEIEDADSFPSGCYECPKSTSNCVKGTWFNTHPTGSGQKDARIYCAKNTLSLESPENGIIFMGDSDVDYWYTSRETLPGSFNYGVGGDTCTKVYNDFISLVKSVTNIKWMVLVCGENDLASGASVNTVFKRFKKIYNAAINKKIKIIMMGTKPEPDTNKLHKKYMKYDKKIMNFAKKEINKKGSPSLIFVDSHNSFKSLGNPKKLYADDELHLSAEGYVRWNEWLQNAYDHALCDDYDNYDDYYDDECTCYVWKKSSCVRKL